MSSKDPESQDVPPAENGNQAVAGGIINLGRMGAANTGSGTQMNVEALYGSVYVSQSSATGDIFNSIPVFQVPFPSNPDFVGRDTELMRLQELLESGATP